MDFPSRIYTEEEVKKARQLIEEGHKHVFKVDGSAAFKQMVRAAIELVKIAGCYDYLRTYIRLVKEIDGLTQLRQAEATIWANKYAVENRVDAASVFIQKAHQMEEYLEGELYYGGAAEKRSYEKRMEFLKTLKTKTQDENVREECQRILNMWKEGSLVY